MSVRICENASQWDNAVKTLGGTLFQSWQWGEYRRIQKWRPWRILIEVQNRVCGAMQIFERRTPLVPFSVMLSPGGVAGSNDIACLKELASWLRSFLKERRGLLVRLEPEFAEDDEASKDLLTSVGFRSLPRVWLPLSEVPRTVMVLDLNRPEAEIFQGMRRNHRSHIQHALKGDVEFVAGRDPAQLEDLHRLLLNTSGRKNFAPPSLENLHHLRRTVLSEYDGAIWLARYQGKTVAGVLVAAFGNSCHCLWAGSDWSFRDLQVNEAVQWKAMQWAKHLGYRDYDLGGHCRDGVPEQDDECYGIYNYKKKFGAELRLRASYFDLPGPRLAYELYRFAEVRGRRAAVILLRETRRLKQAIISTRRTSEAPSGASG